MMRWRLFWRRKELERDLADEIEFDLTAEADERVRSGMSRDDAERTSRRDFGNVLFLKEEVRQTWGWTWLERLMQDFRYAWRALAKDRLFTIMAVLSLALGIGANTAIFSIVNAVLLRSLPFPEPERLVRIFFSNPGLGMRGVLYSVPELEDLRNRAGVFEYVTGTERGSLNMTGGSQPERLEMITASANYFAMLGVSPQIGRLFGLEDNMPGLAPSVVISDSLWRSEFAADAKVLGRTIHLDGEAFQIVGVLPPNFRNPGRTGDHDVEVWLASGYMSPADPKPLRSARAFPGALGRLKRGISLEQAQARLTAMATEIRRDYPADYPSQAQWTIEIAPMQ